MEKLNSIITFPDGAFEKKKRKSKTIIREDTYIGNVTQVPLKLGYNPQQSYSRKRKYQPEQEYYAATAATAATVASTNTNFEEEEEDDNIYDEYIVHNHVRREIEGQRKKVMSREKKLEQLERKREVNFIGADNDYKRRVKEAEDRLFVDRGQIDKNYHLAVAKVLREYGNISREDPILKKFGDDVKQLLLVHEPQFTFILYSQNEYSGGITACTSISMAAVYTILIGLPDGDLDLRGKPWSKIVQTGCNLWKFWKKESQKKNPMDIQSLYSSENYQTINDVWKCSAVKSMTEKYDIDEYGGFMDPNRNKKYKEEQQKNVKDGGGTVHYDMEELFQMMIEKSKEIKRSCAMVLTAFDSSISIYYITNETGENGTFWLFDSHGSQRNGHCALMKFINQESLTHFVLNSFFEINRLPGQRFIHQHQKKTEQESISSSYAALAIFSLKKNI
jgi:hypothetical protein